MAYFHCLIGGGSSGGGYELTVTCDSDFSGTTITCTDGVTTLTQTCPSSSPYEVVFEIPNGGDWTISGVVSGQTVSTGVNIPTTATLEAIVQKTITIYSAKEDTITYTDIYGDTQTEVFASGQTSKQITIDIESSGSSITFTSGVAKDPSNLSNYYSKTVTITSNTTEVYLMPDGAIYWWGYKPSNYEMSNGWTPSGFSGWNSPSITENTNSLKISGTSSNYSSFGWIKPKADNSSRACMIIKSATTNNNHWVVENIANGISLASADSFAGDITTAGKYETTITGNNQYLCGRTFPGYYVEYSALWYE